MFQKRNLSDWDYPSSILRTKVITVSTNSAGTTLCSYGGKKKNNRPLSHTTHKTQLRIDHKPKQKRKTTKQ